MSARIDVEQLTGLTKPEAGVVGVLRDFCDTIERTGRRMPARLCVTRGQHLRLMSAAKKKRGARGHA